MSPQVTDLRLVVGLVLAGTLALLLPGVPWQLEWVFGLPLLLMLPGYAAVAALFPERPGTTENGVGWPARFGLSLVGSAGVVAVVGVLFAAEASLGLTLTTAVLSLGAVTLLAVGIAVVRRGSLPQDRRADPVAGASLGAMTRAFGTSGLQSLVLVIAVVLLASTLVFAGSGPPEDPHSEVYLTGGDSVDIEPGNGTQEMVTGADTTLSLAIENHEGDSVDYQVIIRLESVDNGTVVAMQQLDDFRVSLAAGETDISERALNSQMTGERLRLHVFVFKGGLDGDIDAESADLVVRLWVDTTDDGSP